MAIMQKTARYILSFAIVGQADTALFIYYLLLPKNPVSTILK